MSVLDRIEDGHYYSGLLFIPSIAKSYYTSGRLTARADSVQCEGFGMQSYGTAFQVVGYDANHQICPIVFSHFIGPGDKESWVKVLKACADIPGFDIDRRVKIVDQEKSIDAAYRDVMKNAGMFHDDHMKGIIPFM